MRACLMSSVVNSGETKQENITSIQQFSVNRPEGVAVEVKRLRLGDGTTEVAFKVKDKTGVYIPNLHVKICFGYS